MNRCRSRSADDASSTRAEGGLTSLNYTRLNEDPDQAHVMVLDLAKGARRVLDVGAATGYLSEAIGKSGADVVSVEVDARAAAIARARGVSVRVGTLQEGVGAQEYFDCILLADVLEHIADADEFLRAALSHLTPDGHLLLSVPNVAHFSLRFALMTGRFDYTDTGLLDRTHLRFYTRSSLEGLLQRHGLEIVDRRHSLGPYTMNPLHVRFIDWCQQRLLRGLASGWPALFAFQFVWKARRARPSATR